jgi:hypothetical protein
MSTGSTMIFKRYPPLTPPKLKDNWTIDIKSHKHKGKPMWIKTEDGKNIWNLDRLNNIDIVEQDGMHRVGISGYNSYTIKSFKYREDAEKYLDELLAQLNEEC